MNIFIDNKSGAPIYDQIYTQIKNQIINGTLKADEAKNVEWLREENLKKIEEHLTEIAKLAVSCNLSRQDIIDMFNIINEEEQ